MSIVFSVEQVKALCGGSFPEAKGFRWQSVEHFEFEDGRFDPYSGPVILPGPPIILEMPNEESTPNPSVINFSIKNHDYRKGIKLVQIQLNSETVGAIYPYMDRPAIKIVSVHMVDKQIDSDFAGQVVDDDGSETWPHIPAVHIQFEKSPWVLGRTGHVIKNPVIHGLLGGSPLCHFSRAVPRDWPDGHLWVGLSEAEKITCTECKKAAEKVK